MSRYSSAAIVAFALGANAAPQGLWDMFGGSAQSSGSGSFPSMPSMSTIPSGCGAPPGVPSAPASFSFPAGGFSMPAAGASGSGIPAGIYAASGTASGSATAPAVTSAPTPSDSASIPASGGKMPASSGTSALDAVQTIAAGESFDGGMVAYDRGVSCTGQEEGGDSDAVFEIEEGGSLSNVIIGPNQVEGVHCFGSCTLTNVWWAAVCEDAFTIKEQGDGETTTITGGGAYGAEDKVLQHNGAGTMSVSGFTVDTFGKLYRSCGNCDEMAERHVIMDDITATGGSELAGINSNYGDTATFTNIQVSDVDDICVTFTGNDSGDEPEENGSGPSDSCLYSESDITEL